MVIAKNPSGEMEVALSELDSFKAWALDCGECEVQEQVSAEVDSCKAKLRFLESKVVQHWASGVVGLKEYAQGTLVQPEVWTALLDAFDRECAMTHLVNNARLDDIVSHLSSMLGGQQMYRSAITKLPGKTCGLPADIWTQSKRVEEQIYQTLALRAYATCILVRCPQTGVQRSKAAYVREAKRLVAALRPDGKAINIPQCYSDALDQAGKYSLCSPLTWLASQSSRTLSEPLNHAEN